MPACHAPTCGGQGHWLKVGIAGRVAARGGCGGGAGGGRAPHLNLGREARTTASVAASMATALCWGVALRRALRGRWFWRCRVLEVIRCSRPCSKGVTHTVQFRSSKKRSRSNRLGRGNGRHPVHGRRVPGGPPLWRPTSAGPTVVARASLPGCIAANPPAPPARAAHQANPPPTQLDFGPRQHGW